MEVVSVPVLIRERLTSTRMLLGSLAGAGTSSTATLPFRSRICFMENDRSEEHTSEVQSPCNLVCRLLLEKKKMLIALKNGPRITMLHFPQFGRVESAFGRVCTPVAAGFSTGWGLTMTKGDQLQIHRRLIEDQLEINWRSIGDQLEINWRLEQLFENANLCPIYLKFIFN